MADIARLYDDRTTAILAGAKSAFAQKGFDGASMQDLARAAGMSAGNFYRYFPSKNAIVAAMIDVDLAGVKQDFEVIVTSADPAQALFDTMCHRIDTLDCDDGPLWAEIDAALGCYAGGHDPFAPGADWDHMLTTARRFYWRQGDVKPRVLRYPNIDFLLALWPVAVELFIDDHEPRGGGHPARIWGRWSDRARCHAESISLSIGR